MTGHTLGHAAVIDDGIETRWESLATQRRVASPLVAVFLLGLVVIEANRRGWLPSGIAEHVPTRHWYAILASFALLLPVGLVVIAVDVGVRSGSGHAEAT